MTKGANVSGDHFDWLVGGRSRNQRSTLDLYKLIEKHEQRISRDVLLHEAAQALVAIAFSLWRAVFLSDLSGDLGHQLSDIKRFLQSLIAHNAVLYQTDFSSREWTFIYYLDNAFFRLKRLGDEGGLRLLTADEMAPEADLAKDRWTNAQSALDLAIANFAKAFDDHDHA